MNDRLATTAFRFTDQEIRTLLSALAAINSSGGGSAPYTLFRRLMTESGQEEDQDLTSTFCNNVLEANEEANTL